MRDNGKFVVVGLLAMLLGIGSLARADWKFAVTDDSRGSGGSSFQTNHVSTAALSVIAKAIAEEPGVELVLFPGDMVSGGGTAPTAAALASELETWKNAMKPVYDKGIPVYATRGNHEFYAGKPFTTDFSVKPFREIYTKPAGSNPVDGPEGEQGLTFSFTHKNATFIGFDQYANRIKGYSPKLFAPGSNKGQSMNGYVLATLKKSTSSVNFVFAHEMLTSTRTHPDCMANDPDSRDALVAALAEHRGAYLCGHDHIYRRAEVSMGNGTVVEVTVGTAGGGNYQYGPFDARAAGYTGPCTYKDVVHISDATCPIFGYLVITVHDDNSWTGEFKGFQFPNWANNDASAPTAFSVKDRFTVKPKP